MIGSPPIGTSMMTLMSSGGLLPMEIASMRMACSEAARKSRKGALLALYISAIPPACRRGTLDKKAIFHILDFGTQRGWVMLGLRYVWRVCGVGFLLAVAAQIALAGPDTPPSSGAPRNGATSSMPHHGASAAHRRHTARPAPHQATTHKEQKKEDVRRSATATPAAPADKSLDQRPLLGGFSLGVETEEKVKRRSIRGGEYDPERDGDPKGLRPPFLGFSLNAPLSW